MEVRGTHLLSHRFTVAVILQNNHKIIQFKLLLFIKLIVNILNNSCKLSQGVLLTSPTQASDRLSALNQDATRVL